MKARGMNLLRWPILHYAHKSYFKLLYIPSTKEAKNGKKSANLGYKTATKTANKKNWFQSYKTLWGLHNFDFFFSSDISPLCYAKHLSMFKILEGVYCVYLLSNLCCSSNVFKSRDPFLKIEFYETILCSTVLFFFQHFWNLFF